jgi:hypothetical protein
MQAIPAGPGSRGRYAQAFDADVTMAMRSGPPPVPSAAAARSSLSSRVTPGRTTSDSFPLAIRSWATSMMPSSKRWTSVFLRLGRSNPQQAERGQLALSTRQSLTGEETDSVASSISGSHLRSVMCVCTP